MMPILAFRIPPELLAEAKRLAAAEGMEVGEWARKLIEKATGMKVEVKIGIAGADEKTRNRVEKARLKGIKQRAKDSNAGK